MRLLIILEKQKFKVKYLNKNDRVWNYSYFRYNIMHSSIMLDFINTNDVIGLQVINLIGVAINERNTSAALLVRLSDALLL